MRHRSTKLRDNLFNFRTYRTCPDCDARYTSDPSTRRRQVPIVVLGLLSTGLLIGGAFTSNLAWSALGVVISLVLMGYAAYAVAKLRYVPYDD